MNEPVASIDQLCQRLKCPKNYEQLAKLSAQFYSFVQSFDSQSVDSIVDFFAKTDALRRKDRFVELLAVYQLLAINVDAIKELTKQLGLIDVAVLDKTNIAQAIASEKRSIIQLFLNSAQ